MKQQSITLIMRLIITAHKRSLGQVDVFTPLCHSVHRGGRGRGSALTPPDADPPWGWADPLRQTPWVGQTLPQCRPPIPWIG